MTGFRYKAFVSYSWADAEWGKWLLHSIETYRTPAALVGKDGAHGPVPARLHPLFKDREEEAAGASIGQAVETALAGSEFLIVICSPRSAQSQWVNREVAWFKTHRDPNNILALIVDGEPGGGDNECFPKALTHQVSADMTVTNIAVDAPLAADARISGDGKRKAKLKLAAAMLGVGLDELVNRDERRRTIRTRLVVGASLSLALVMSGMAWFAIQARNEAQVQRGQAEGLVEFMIGDLRKNLQPKVQIEVLGSIADRAKAFYAVQGKYKMDEEALGRRARVLKLLADLEADRGHSDQSLALFKQSVAASGELLKRDPDNPDRILEQGFALQGLGTFLFQRGDLVAAEGYMQQAVDLTRHLVEDVGQKDEWLAEHASALSNLGVVQLQQNHLEQAQDNLNKSIAIKRRAIKLDDRKHTGWTDFAYSLSWAADAAFRQGNLAQTKALRAEEQDLYRRMLAQDPDDQIAMSSLTISRRKLAEELLLQNDLHGALAIAQEVDVQTGKSLAADPGNLTMVEDAANSKLVLANVELQVGNLTLAQQAAERAEALAQRLVADDPAVLKWSGVLLGQARLTGYAARARRAAGAACLSALAPVAAESARLDALLAAHRGDPKLTMTVARGLIMRGDASALAGDFGSAKAAWDKAGTTLGSLYGSLDAIRDPGGRALADQLHQRQTAPRMVAAKGAVCG
ncbi:MAG: TIR domain-containing protein [Novosphingobium sp.]